MKAPTWTTAMQNKPKVMAVHGKSPYLIGDGKGWRGKVSIREDFLEEEACELNFEM